MEYKFHQHKFDNMNRYYDVIRSAMNQLGHSEVLEPYSADINFYNHIHSFGDHRIIVKPTAPTAKHFALDLHGYANTSEIAYEDPYVYEYMYSHLNPKNNMDWSIITDLIEKKSNKWDDSILLKWRKSKIKIPEEHILVIGQMPDDETVNGFGFGDHWKKLCMTVEFLKKFTGFDTVVKLHPSMKLRGKQRDIVDGWIQSGITVIDGFISIHDILPKTYVAIVDNSTAGIECLMHEVPVISHGWPEYHWVTAKVQTLPHMESLLRDLSWHEKRRAKQFIYWYINDYLCTDIDSTVNRLKELI